MASVLRQIVAGPRARHPEARLDLCYLTDFIVVTSGPSSVWPKKAYRNPLDQVVAFLDKKHGEEWAIFEFRAEGTGYPDSEVYNRVHHFPWPDHHPPPFAIIPNLMAAMRNWIQRLDEEPSTTGEKKPPRVAVVHCKAGKGRSGTVACSYLISEEGWKKEDALARFTERRMRPGFGNGVSIPSQLRWVNYVDSWTNRLGKRYVERPVEVVEIHVWGLRDGVKVSVEGYVDSGRHIRHFHTFKREEKIVVDGPGREPARPQPDKTQANSDSEILVSASEGTAQSSDSSLSGKAIGSAQSVILKPSTPLILPTSDINVDFERRNKAAYTGWTMVTSLAHVWFNTFFEGGHEGHDSGIFEIEWDAMDGVKGSARKGIRALDRLKVVWKYASAEDSGLAPEREIKEPAKGEPVPENPPADWRGEENTESRPADGLNSGRPGGIALTVGAAISQGVATLGKDLGLRKSQPDSANLSRASSVKESSVPQSSVPESVTDADVKDAESDDEGVQPRGPSGEDRLDVDSVDEGTGSKETAHDATTVKTSENDTTK